MIRSLVTLAVVALLPVPGVAAIAPYPAEFHTTTLQTNGTSIHVRYGGKGSAVALDQDCVARPHTVSATQLPPLSSSVVKGLLQRCSRLRQCRTNGGGVADGVQEHEVVDRAVVAL